MAILLIFSQNVKKKIHTWLTHWMIAWLKTVLKLKDLTYIHLFYVESSICVILNDIRQTKKHYSVILSAIDWLGEGQTVS